MRKKLLFAVALVLSACTMNVNLFAVSDISGHWAESTINALIEDGFISGYSDNTVKPDNTITRAEFISFVNRIFDFENYSDVDFSDLDKNKWYYKDIAIAYEKGYITKYSDGTIRPENNITRQEAAVIICKILGFNQNEAAAQYFNDYSLISSWAVGYVGAVYENGIVKGSSDKCFYPLNFMTRAEAFTILKTASDYYKSSNAIASEAVEETKITTTEISTETTTAQTTTQSSYKIPKRVATVKEWETAVKYAVNNLYDVLEIEVEGFNENDYDLKSLNITNISITASGTIKDNVAYLKYEFNYERENFKLVRAIEDSSLMSKLSQSQISALNYLKNTAQAITSSAANDYEKEKAIHDFIVKNFSYPNTSDSTYYNVTGALETKIAYCDAAANMFYIMGHYAGLECGFVEGTLEGQNHLWNYIVLDGNYYHVDVTADLYIVSEDNYGVTYKVFNVPDDWITGQYIWDKELNNNISCVSTKYNYYYYNNLVFSDMDKLISYIEQNIVNKPENLSFYADGIDADSDFLSQSQVPKYIKSYMIATALKNKQQCKVFVPVYR